jgi:selenoprotein W-related protein
MPDMADSKPEIVITYCTQCQWLLRAAWLAQELLSTFADDLGRVALEPGTGGVFRITCDGVQIWERKADGGFPEAKVLKQRVRDQIDPSATWATTTADQAPSATRGGCSAAMRLDSTMAKMISAPPSSMRTVGVSANTSQATAMP